MNRNRIRILIWGLALVAGVVIFGQVQAVDPEGITFNCYFDEANQRIVYSVAGGAAILYTVDGTAQGCATLAGAVPDLNGPNDNDVVALNCATFSSTGTVVITFKDGATILRNFTFHFSCDNACHITEAAPGPTLSEWGIIALLAMLAITGVVILRRKRVIAQV